MGLHEGLRFKAESFGFRVSALGYAPSEPNTPYVRSSEEYFLNHIRGSSIT